MAECGARQVNSRLKMQKIAKKTLALQQMILRKNAPT
jgi:hypothetical protein